MKMWRAMVWMLTGLAAGSGARLAFTLPPEKIKPLATAATAKRTSLESAEDVKEHSGPRPAEQDILHARGGKRLRLLLEWLPGANGDELLLMADALTKPDQGDNLSIRLLMARWAEVNPAAMVSWARAQQNGVTGIDFYINYAVEAWARVDFDSAWSAAATLPSARISALLGLTAAAPDKCLRLLRETPLLLEQEGWPDMQKVIRRIAARDPAGMAAFLDGGPTPRLMKFAGGVALAWSKTDPAAAMTWILRLDPAVRSATLEDAGKWIATHAPEHLPALLDSLPAGRPRSMIQSAGFAQLASTNPAAARAQLESMPAGSLRQYCRALLMKELFHSGDETGAVALASQLGWQLKDEWCPGTSTTVTSHGSGMSRKGADDSPIVEAMQELMATVAARNPSEAADLLAKCGRESATNLLTCEREINGAGLATAMMEHGSDMAREHCELLLGSWSSRDPAAAAEWAVSGGGRQRDKFLEIIFRQWAADQPEDASAWVGSLPPGARRTNAAEGIARHLSSAGDHEGAFAWAATLPEDRRGDVLAKTVHAWRLENAAAAEAAIRASGLLPEEQRALIDASPPP